MQPGRSTERRPQSRGSQEKAHARANGSRRLHGNWDTKPSKKRAACVRTSIELYRAPGQPRAATPAGGEKLRRGRTRSRAWPAIKPAVKLDHAAIIAKVKAKLASDVGLSTVTGIDVDASGQVVTLRGTVARESRNSRPSKPSMQVNGVTRVVNRADGQTLRVRLSFRRLIVPRHFGDPQRQSTVRPSCRSDSRWSALRPRRISRTLIYKDVAFQDPRDQVRIAGVIDVLRARAARRRHRSSSRHRA